MDIQINDKINLWTITAGPIHKFNRIKHWVCTCECGTVKEVSDFSLRNGKPYSCGCTWKPVSEETRERLSERRNTQPAPRLGQIQTEEAKSKISAANKGRKKPEGWTPWTPERIARQAQKNLLKQQGVSK